MFSRYYSSTLILATALLLVASPGVTRAQPSLHADTSMGTLVTTEWLTRHLNDSDLVILDCTVRMTPNKSGGLRSLSGRPGYEGGHIPTAGFADLMGDLCDPDSSMAFAMPNPERFCAVMGALGVGDDARVVLYDSYKSVWAARVWWMLRWIGFDRVAVLDGGLKAWADEGRPLSTGPDHHQTRRLTLRLRPALIADQKEVRGAIGSNRILLVDAMHAPHFAGKVSMYGRPGHIPGALNTPATTLINASGRYRSHDELAALCAGNRSARVITYCGAGVAASSNAFVLHRLGFENVAVYMASLQEWAADPANPLVMEEP